MRHVLDLVVKVGTPVTGVFGETKGHATAPAGSPASAGPTVPTNDDTKISPDTYKVDA